MTYNKKRNDSPDKQAMMNCLSSMQLSLEDAEIVNLVWLDENDIGKLISIINAENEIICKICENLNDHKLIYGSVKEVIDQQTAKINNYCYCLDGVMIGDFIKGCLKVCCYAELDKLPKMGVTFGQVIHVYTEDVIYVDQNGKRCEKPKENMKINNFHKATPRPVQIGMRQIPSIRRVDSVSSLNVGSVRRVNSVVQNGNNNLNKKIVYTFKLVRYRNI